MVQVPATLLTSSEIEIQLTPATLTLDEVLITPTDALDLVRQAIAAWPENRRSGAVNFQGFFRELLAEDGRYVQLNEAVTRYYLTGDEANTVQVELLRARTLKDSSDFKSIRINMGAGQIHQMVKTGPTDEKMAEDFLDERHFKLYEYVLDTVLYRDGRPTYVISVDQDRKLRKKLYKATVRMAAFLPPRGGADLLQRAWVLRWPFRYHIRCPRTGHYPDCCTPSHPLRAPVYD
ncbi:MAG: hypothetical protein EAZ89_17900 [Bacteroidetes bacterium]|nr:MAG: hypothetical protein EAZ89_17900 [Bacteroidota bacterium]